MPNLWERSEHAKGYLARADRLPHRREGEAVLTGDLSDALPGRILDLGCGDGRLASLVLEAYPESSALCVDMSTTMLEAAAARFGSDDRVTLLRHDLDDPFAGEGSFDAVVSSFAIHHVSDARKQDLYSEIAALLTPGGVFCNLDLVASPTRALHEKWRGEMGVEDDPSDMLCDLPIQLQWLAGVGLRDVDCIWKWRSLALIRGQKVR
ncbi:MAG: class I SAM-dependent methyltransferase [Actinobacteria bacterium]|nr:MAG: class I SAM-dependent methyltransferase [Actinomycetota bacterium]